MSNQAFDAFNALAEAVGHLAVRLTALEEHITRYGPRVQRSDYDAPGVATWYEPYRPPETP